MSDDLLAGILGRGALVLAGVALIVALLRGRSAAHRHLLWTLGATTALALPIALAAMPRITVPVLPSRAPIAPGTMGTTADGTASVRTGIDASVRDPADPARREVLSPGPAARVAAERLATDGHDAPASSGVVAAASAPGPGAAPGVGADTRDAAGTTSGTWLALAWAAGALVVLGRLAVAHLRVRRLLRTAHPLEDGDVADAARAAAAHLGIREPVAIVTHDTVASPATVGVLRPTVVLPRAALDWTRDRLRMALLHEMAHVARRDLLAELVARLAAAIHWPNPLAWLALARMHSERERACDDLVLAGGTEPADYAGFLVGLARVSRRDRPLAMAASMSSGPPLERRVRALLDSRGRRNAPTLAVRVALGAATVASLAACSMFEAGPREADPSGDGTPVAATTPAAAASEDPVPAEPPVATTATPSAPIRPNAVVITVAPDGRGDHATIAAAVAAAPPGAVVRIAEGNWNERILVTKALTIEGAGADATRIVNHVAVGSGPTLRVSGAKDVVIRGVTLTLRGPVEARSTGSGTVVEIENSAVRIERAAVYGSPGNGVNAGPGSAIEIVDSLVAGAWGTGVAIDGSATARVTGSDIRNCRHRGITVAPGNRSTTIEGCRISGSSWHGIRYDDAAPVVRGNLIFDNERCGIYASGRTEGRIEGNLFFENGMSDVGCWDASRDVIERNSFVRSKREAVAVLGTATPTVRRNVFFECVTAILGAHVADGGAYAGGATIESNVFWKNGTEFTSPSADGKGVAATALPASNAVVDPGFRDPTKRDFTLPPESAAARRDVGAPSPPSFESPWRVRPDERAVAPGTPATPPAPSATAPRPAPGTPRSPTAAEVIAAAKADVVQIRDAAQRERGLAVIFDALRSDDPALLRAALAVLHQLGDVQFDRARIRPDIVRLLGHADPGIAAQAAYAVRLLPREPGDLQLVLDVAAKQDPPSHTLLHAALGLNESRAEGPLGDLYVRALAAEGGRTAMEAANTLRGAWVSEAVESAVVAAWRRWLPGDGRGSWQYTFGQMRPVREVRVRAIFDMMAGGDEGVRQLAGRALLRPVEDAAKPVAATLAMAAAATATLPGFRQTYLDIVRANGSSAQVPALRALAANELLAEDVRKVATSIADELEKRP